MLTSLRSRISALAAIALLSLAVPASAQVPNYDAFYAFGDSIADNGNDFIAGKLLGSNPSAPPSESPFKTYFKGRFSNGYVAFEYLWQMIGGGAPGTSRGMRPFMSTPLLPLNGSVNFAFGGTGTPFLDQTPGGAFMPGLKGQIELFRVALLGRKPAKRTLYAIVTGTNDYRDDQFNVPMDIDEVVGNIVDSIRSLYQMGGRDIMVVNLPDLGVVPAYAANRAQATALSTAHNAALSAALDNLETELPKLRLIRPDLFEAFYRLPPALNSAIPALEVLFAGEQLGYPISACLFINLTLCRDVPVPFNTDLGFVFWDIIHPTTEAHRSVAQYFYSVLQEAF